MCEKPLGRNAAESAKMVEAVEHAGVPNMVWYNYRRVPAVTLAKQLIDEGRLGKIFHYRAKFLQDWTISKRSAAGRRGAVAPGRERRGQRRHRRPAGALHRHRHVAERRHRRGVRHDRDLHQERKHNLTGKVEPVGIDDASAFLARFANGSLATFEATRYARGHKALYTLEINGEHASIIWDLHDLHRLQYFDHRDEGPLRGWRSLHITDGDHPYMKHWWVPGLADRIRAHLHPPGRRFPRGLGFRQGGGADVPRWPRHGSGDGRCAPLGEVGSVGAPRRVTGSAMRE